ncbi:hypothetical protein HY498_02945 [Candidatus Woesearchaeota archaeon]|nr:hypothetical protein [Candidatus Woesearchaeota archaeon]
MRKLILNKKGDYDLGRKALYIFMASVFLTFVFVTFYGLLVNMKAETFKTKDFIEGSAIKYVLTHSSNCFASDLYKIPVIDLNKFTSENLRKCTSNFKKSIKINLFDGGKLFKSEITNGIGGYKRRDDKALVLVDNNGELKTLVMGLEYGD